MTKTRERLSAIEYGFFCGVIFGLVGLSLESRDIGVGSVVNATERSSQWSSVRAAYASTHPRCEYCGRLLNNKSKNPEDRGEVHHVKPVSIYPELELDMDNLIMLCDPCHNTAGHLDRHYQSWNPLIREEAKQHRTMVEARPKTKKEAEAFVRRFRKCFDESNYQQAD